MFTYICDVIKFTLNKGTAMDKQMKLATALRMHEVAQKAVREYYGYDTRDTERVKKYKEACYRNDELGHIVRTLQQELGV